jgi:hypothetical protein
MSFLTPSGLWPAARHTAFRWVMGLACAAMMLAQSGCVFAVVRGAKEVYKAYSQPEKELVASLELLAGYGQEGPPELAAMVFAADAEWAMAGQPPLHGRPAIAKALQSGAAVSFAHCTFTPESSSVDDDKGTQKGSYLIQRPASAKWPAWKASGHFEATWAHQRDGRWLLKRLDMTPASSSAEG